MANKDLSQKLKQARINGGFSQKQVCEKFGIKQSSFSSWETGLAEPNIKTFLELCNTYDIEDVYDYFCGPRTKYNLHKYDPKLNEVIIKLKELYNSPERFEAVVNCLNFEYERYLEFRVVKFPNECRLIPVYLQSDVAGLGNYISDEDVELMDLPAPPEADAGIHISGDSMEPEICDDEIVYIKYTPHVNVGDIGIFIYGDDVYCKKLDMINGKPCLVSLNSKYDPIFFFSGDNFRTVGKILI